MAVSRADPAPDSVPPLQISADPRSAQTPAYAIGQRAFPARRRACHIGSALEDVLNPSNDKVERFAARLAVLQFDSDAAAHAANIRATLERVGTTIGAYDLMIAGHARSRGPIVVTSNLREFTRVDGLRAEDWLAAPR